MRVQVGDQIFETVKEAAAFYQVKPRVIYDRIYRGKLESLAVPGKDGRSWAGIPVTIRGVTYPTYKAAAAAVGVTANAITRAHQRGTLETVGLRLRRGGRPSKAKDNGAA